MALARGHAPLAGSGGDQQLFGGRAGNPEVVPAIRRAAAAANHLAAVAVVQRSLLDLHALPVHFQVLGHDHREGGLHALAALGVLADDRDLAVGVDADIEVRYPLAFLQGIRVDVVETAAADDQGARGEQRDLEECTPIQALVLIGGVHASPPLSAAYPAARFIALLMRG